MTQTKKENLVDVEVFAASVDEKLGDKIKLTQFAYQEDITGQAGSVNVPKYNYIGAADVVAEGEEAVAKQMTQGSENVPIVKVVTNVEMTKEAIKSGLGDPVGKAEEMLISSIAEGIENKLFADLRTATKEIEVAKVDGDAVLLGLSNFDADAVENTKALLVNIKELPNVVKNRAYEDGKLYGLEVVYSNKVKANEAFIIENGALGLYTAGAVEVETDNDVIVKAKVFSADKFFASHLRDDSKVVKFKIVAADDTNAEG